MPPVRKLGELLDGIVAPEALAPHRECVATGVYDDSRAVTAGGIFVALQGSTADGRRYIGDALERGAAVLIGQNLERTERAAVLNVDDARAALARLAQRWHGVESARPGALTLLGVTGTNGKSTTAFMARAIMQAGGHKCGLLGTVYYDLCSRTVAAEMTTPGPLKLAEYLRVCADAGASAAVMEVSSHALDQRRTDGLRFAAAAFTNLTGDHLDYHKTFENYGAAKARLFAGLDADATAVVNCDDRSCELMIRDCRARVVRYSIDGAADITASITRDSIEGTLYRMRVHGTEIILENAIVGRHNVYNALAAAGLASAAGVSIEKIRAGLASVRNVPGRLQRVPCGIDVHVFVDYAHTDDALKNVLSVLRPLTKGRLITVFGCGGDRDKTKRPRMARAAAEYADVVFVTSDNPRSEPPDAIIAEIVVGFDERGRGKVRIEPDRRAAIGAALAASQRGDVVLIAGKGHENYQVVGTERIHFDDVEVAIQAAAGLRRGTG